MWSPDSYGVCIYPWTRNCCTCNMCPFIWPFSFQYAGASCGIYHLVYLRQSFEMLCGMPWVWIYSRLHPRRRLSVKWSDTAINIWYTAVHGKHGALNIVRTAVSFFLPLSISSTDWFKLITGLPRGTLPCGLCFIRTRFLHYAGSCLAFASAN